MHRLFLLAAALLSSASALADPCDNLRNIEKQYRECINDWYGRSNQKSNPIDPSPIVESLKKLEQEEAANRRSAKESYDAWKKTPGAVAEKERAARVIQEANAKDAKAYGEVIKGYKSYREGALEPVRKRLQAVDFSSNALGPYRFNLPILMSVPFHQEMMGWATKAYQQAPNQYEAVLGFLIAADPCADNPHEIGYPISNDWKFAFSLFRYGQAGNIHKKCIFGRMYKALPHFMNSLKADFIPHRALSCAQISAWMERHFDGATPRSDKKYGGPIYDGRDYLFLKGHLDRCLEALPNQKAFLEGLIKPAGEWSKRTGYYFSDVRLTQLYDVNAWKDVSDFSDVQKIRAVFDGAIEGFDQITKEYPKVFFSNDMQAGITGLR